MQGTSLVPAITRRLHGKLRSSLETYFSACGGLCGQSILDALVVVCNNGRREFTTQEVLFLE